MEAVAHSEKFAKKVGVPMSVGKEFSKADKGKTFRLGGFANSAKAKMNKAKTNHGLMQMPNASLNKYVGKNTGGIMKHDDMKQDKPMMKKIADVEAKKVVKGHEKRMHKMASGGKASQLNKANGIAVKGKSKGTMIKMNKGGSC
jgi:hypothetical protein